MSKPRSYGGPACKAGAWSKRTSRERELFLRYTYQPLQQPELPWDPQSNLHERGEMEEQDREASLNMRVKIQIHSNSPKGLSILKGSFDSISEFVSRPELEPIFLVSS